MISYDNYLNRIQKLAKFKNFVHKFRFLIIGLFSLIIAATTGLLIAKGAVMTAMTLPAQVVYGDYYEPTPASAFMSSVSYEYRLEEGGKWSGTKPDKAGKYLARTVTDKAFGKGYSDPVRFEILPREVEFIIGAKSVVYGEVPEGCRVTDLVLGNKLVTEELLFKYASLATATTNAYSGRAYTGKSYVDTLYVDQNSVKIVNTNGEDYTSCYKISFAKVEKGVELEVLPRSITIQPKGYEYTYSDGEVPVKNELTEKSLSQLAYGDTIEVENGVVNGSGAPKNRGNYQIGVKTFKIMHGSVDVTDRYNVETVAAQLIINARKITITTGTTVKDEYDGVAIQNTDVDTDGLIDGHILYAKEAFRTLTDAGEIQNYNEFEIYSGSERVTDNYIIIPEYGTLKIGKRKMTVKTGDNKDVYNGEKLFNYEYDIIIGSLAYGQTAEINYYGIYNVWESGENRLELTIFDIRYNPVTYNYEIAYEYGTLTLTPREITIKTDDNYGIYNGDLLYNHNYNVTSGSIVSGQDNYVLNKTFGIYNVNESVEKNNKLIIGIFEWIDGSLEDISKSNYNITYDYGTLTLTKRPIVVTTNTPAAVIFDGDYHSNDGYITRYYGEDKEGLVNDYKLTVSNLTRIRDVDKVENKFDIVDESGNYDIKIVNYGWLEITPRPIIVQTVNDDKTYDGTALKNPAIRRTYYSGNENEFGLAAGDENVLEVDYESYVAEITDVGSTPNKFSFKAHKNYEIRDVVPGTLTVDPRPLSFKISDINLKYGDIIVYPYVGSYEEGTLSGLVNTETLNLFVRFDGITEGTLNDATTYNITLDRDNTKITKANAEDSTGNYIITYSEAILTIEQLKIIVTTGSGEKEYDGSALFSEEIIISEKTPLAEGQYFEIDFTREITEVDETFEGNNDTTIRIVDGYNDVTRNYDIEYNCGTLTITPRQIAVKTLDGEWVYDGDAHSREDYETFHVGDNDRGLIGEDEELTLISAAYITVVGNGQGVPNVCKFEVPNSNYEIVEDECEYGTLKVTPRKIIFSTKSTEKVYDGTPLTCDEYETKYFLSGGDKNGNTAGLIGDDKLTLEGELASITVVGFTPNSNNYTTGSNSNYEIYDHRYGTLSVTVREIVVVTDSAVKEEYDGAPLSCITYTTYLLDHKDRLGLIEGDGNLELTHVAYAVNAGSYDNNCQFTVPSTNYRIADYEYGKLIINPKEITVEISEVEDVTYGETFVYPTGKNNFKNVATCGLVNGEQMEIGVYCFIDAETEERVDAKNAFKYFITLDKDATTVYNSAGEVIDNGIGNYKITVIESSAEILRKVVNITIEDTGITYGEYEDFIPKYSFDVLPEDMPYGEQIIPGFRYRYFALSNLYNDTVEYCDVIRHVGKYEPFLAIDLCFVVGGDATVSYVNLNYALTCDTATVTVNPKEITVEINDISGVEYGEDYSYTLEAGNYKNELDLPYGDTVTVYAIMPEFEGDYLGVGTYTIKANKDKTLVNGLPDTSDYIIEFVDGELEIVQRRIIVVNGKLDKVYDGEKLVGPHYTTYHADNKFKQGLLGDDTLTLIGELVSITNVSESGTLNANRYQDLDNYEIVDYVDEELVIYKRVIVIASKDEEYEYNGEYQYAQSPVDDAESYHYNEITGEKEPALVLDHHFIIGDPVGIKDVGWVYNTRFEGNEIYDGEGSKVTDNYEISDTISGKLIITPRRIAVRTHSADKPYDGTPLTCDGYSTYYYIDDNPESYTEESVVGLVGSDELILIGELASVTNVWEGVVGNLNSYKSPVGEQDNANYEIMLVTCGTLKITHRRIIVEIDDQTKEYDGYPYLIKAEPDNYANYITCNLADGEKLQIAVKFTVTDEEGNALPYAGKFNVGTYRIKFDIENCVIYKDGEVLERGVQNYAFKCEGATLTITPRQVEVTINDILDAVYGDEIEFNGFTLDIGELPEVDGVKEELTFEYFFAKYDAEPVTGIFRAGSYSICAYENTAQVINGSIDNYEFTFYDGTLIVSPKEVEVTLKSYEITYGEEFEYPEGADCYEPLELPYGDTLEVFLKALAYEKLNADIYYLEADEDKTLVNGSDDTSDYIFTFTSGTLTVEKRGITLKLNEPDREYTYGETYTYGEGIGNYLYAENLAYDEKLEVVVTYYKDGEYFDEPKNAGTYDVIVKGLIIYDELGYLIEDGGDNYYVEDIENVAVQLTVERKRIKLEVDDSEYIYGFEAPEITFTIYDFDTDEEAELLPFGEVFTFDFFYTVNGNVVKPENAGEYIIRTSVDMAYINGEREGVENYIIYGSRAATLTIHARKIVVETNTSCHEYDGTDYSDTFVNSYFYNEDDLYDRSIEGFVNGYQPEIDWDRVPTVTNVSQGRVLNKFDFTVSDNYEIVGEISYGEIWITQRALTVTLYTGLSIIYGEVFNYPVYNGNYLSAEGLLEGDILRVSPYLSADKAIPDVGECEIKAIKNQTLINGELYDAATSNYDLEIISGWLTITPRRIIIASASATKEYDGEPLTAPSENPDECYYIDARGILAQPALVGDHKFVAGEYPSITEVGTITNTCYGGGVVDGNGNPIKEGNYVIIMEGSGTLTVTPRKITVQTGSDEKVYDGDELSETTIEIIENFIPDRQRYELDFVRSIINVSETYEGNNDTTIKIFDNVTGDEVTDNYIIFYSCGTLTVLQREIVVVTPDDDWVYNGETHYNYQSSTYYLGDPDMDGLVYFDTLVHLTHATIRDVGKIENDCTYSVSDNYLIVRIEKGWLTVTERHITIVTSSKSKPYDGTALSAPSYEYTYRTDDDSQPGLVGTDGYGLILDEDSVRYIKEVGESCENKLVFTPESDNYIIDGYDYGWLEITQRYLIVKTATASKTYDGEPLEDSTNYTIWLYDRETGERTEGGLLEGDELILVGTPTSITEVGTTDNLCTYKVPNENYFLVQIECGTLTVEPAPLTIVLKEVQSVDYGDRLYYPDEENNFVSAEGLIEGEKLVKVAVYFADVNGNRIDTPVNAGEYRIYIDLENTVVEYTVDKGLTKGIGNYDVDCDFRTAKINKRKLSVTLNDKEYEYNGDVHRYERNDFGLEGEIAEGETLMISVNYYNEQGELLGGAPTDAGNYRVVLDTENCLINGAVNASLNYEIVAVNEADFIIIPAKFYVEFGDAEYTYDGNEFDYTTSNKFRVVGLCYYDEIEFSVKYYLNGIETPPVNAGEYKVELDIGSINFTWGNPDNYEFDRSEGNRTCTLTINPRPLLVKVIDRQVEYTVEVNPEDERYIAGSTVGGAAFVYDDEDYLMPVFYYDGKKEPPTELGEYSVTLEFLNRDENRDVIGNYKIDLTPGILKIVGRKVIVTPYYSGREIEYTGEEVNVEELKLSGLLGIKHVHDDEDGENGFSDEDFENLEIVYEFIDEAHGVRYENGAAPKNAGSYYIVVKISGFDRNKYEVTNERSVDFFVIRPKDINVAGIDNITKQYDKSAPQAPEIVCGSGLVPADEMNNYAILPKYIDDNGAELKAYNAGTYVIEVKVVDENGVESYNYNVIYDNGKGTLTITPVTLYIKPVSKKELYEGQIISLAKSDYEFVDGPNGEHSKIVPGDRIEITPSTNLDPTKNVVSVSITKAFVYDVNGNDMSGNYNLYYAYDRNVMGSGYNSSSFKGTLEYEIRTVYYRQTVPADQRVLPYDGAAKTISGDELYEIVEGKGDGLYGTDTIVVLSSTVGPQVGEYYNWLKLAVYNEEGKNISRVYNLVLDNYGEEGSYVTIGVINITLEIDPEIEDGKLGDEGYFYSADLFEGRKALDKNYYTLSGVMEGQNYDVIAIKSNGNWYFAVVIYTVKDGSGSLTDKSDCYDLVTITKSEKLSVVCQVVICHSLSTIQSDIDFTLINVGYEDLEKLVDGIDVENTYDGRPALDSSQYSIAGLLPDHKSNTTVVVIRSNRVITLAVLITNGKSDRSYYYNLYNCEFPENFPEENVNILLVSSLMEVKRDVTISITADLDNISPSEGLYETFDGRWALVDSEEYYTVSGLLAGHTVQIIPVMTGGGVTLAVLIFEAKLSGGAMSGRSDKSYLYNLVVEDAPEGAEVRLISSLNEIVTDIKITLNITADDLKNGEGFIVKSKVDERWVLAEGTFEIANNFGAYPLASGIELEIIVDRADEDNFNLYVIVYQLSSTGKRSDRSYLYNVTCESTDTNIKVTYKSLPLGDEGKNQL